MILVVNCECGNEIRTDSANAGKRGRCPHCRREFVVPAEGEMVPERSRRASRPSPAAAPAAPSDPDAPPDDRAPWLDNLARELPPVPPLPHLASPPHPAPPARASRPAEIPETASAELAPIELEAKPEKKARCAACDGQFPAPALLQVDGRRLCPACAKGKERERSLLAALPYVLVAVALVCFVGGLVWSARRATEPDPIAQLDQAEREESEAKQAKTDEKARKVEPAPAPTPVPPSPFPPPAPTSSPPPASDPEAPLPAAAPAPPAPAPDVPAKADGNMIDPMTLAGTWRGATVEGCRFEFTVKKGVVTWVYAAYRLPGEEDNRYVSAEGRVAEIKAGASGPEFSLSRQSELTGTHGKKMDLSLRAEGSFPSRTAAKGTIEVHADGQLAYRSTCDLVREDRPKEPREAEPAEAENGGSKPKEQTPSGQPPVARNDEKAAPHPPAEGKADAGGEEEAPSEEAPNKAAPSEAATAKDSEAKTPAEKKSAPMGKSVKKGAAPVPLSKRVDGDWFGQIEGGAPIRFRVEKGAITSLSIGTAKYPGLDNVTELRPQPGAKGAGWKVKSGQFVIEDRKVYRAVQNGTPVRVETEFTIQGKFKDEKLAVGKIVITQLAMIPGRSNVTLEPGQSWVADREGPAGDEKKD